jgi:UDP:flavonoid glycosyltransferase YjiC (YdhE family)
MTEKNRRILLAWEMGAGFGHIRRLLVLARALKERGWTAIIGQRQIHTLADEVAAAGFVQFQCPQHRSLAPAGQVFRAHSFADIMGVCGFARRDALVPVVDVWDTMLDLIRPAVIVGDYSPILPLAARGRYPFVAFGDGFVVPPPLKEPFRPLRQQGAPVFNAEEILSTTQELLRQRGQPDIDSLAELVAGDQQAVITFPDLDVYNAVRANPAIGPLDEPPPMMPIVDGQPVKLFVYLAADFGETRKVLQALVDSKVPAEAFIRDASDDLKKALRKRGVMVYDQPPPLADVLAPATGIIHHGGMGTLETALCIGRPQLLVPRHLEQALNARNLAGKGLAKILPIQEVPDMFVSIQKFSQDQSFSAASLAKAETLNQQRPLSSLARAIEIIEKIVV